MRPPSRSPDSGSVTSNTSRGRRRGRRGGGGSGNSNNNVALAHADRPVAAALALLMVIYCVVTLATYSKVSLTDDATAIRPTTPTQQSQQSQPVAAAASQTSRRTAAQQPENAQHQPAGLPAIQTLQATFPIHVSPADTIEIPHPGYQLLAPNRQKSSWPAGLPTTMKVPEFFDISHAAPYGTSSIREFLGSGQLLTPEKAARIGSTVMDAEGNELETIYCSVASYRDPECSGTVADVFARAAHPERIRLAVLDQRTEGDPICAVPVNCEPYDAVQASGQELDKTDDNAVLCKYRHQLDRYEMDARFGVGPVFARHLAHRHYRGEYFAMQIDSHVRFVEHWDADLVGQWKSAHNEMAVLTTYLSDIIGSIDPVTHESKHPNRPIMCESDFEGHGAYKHLRHGQQPEGLAGIHNQPTLHPFWAAGFSFARGHFVIQVPYDQYLPMVFQGEEISIGLRGFTYGYDYYAPERGVCFHMYAIKENTAKRKKVPLFWENGNLYQGTGTKAMKRLNAIIGMENYDDSEWQTDEREKYGLGKARQTSTFFDTFGIHTAQHTVEHHLCRFVGKPMMREFLPARRPNGMGLDYDQIHYRFVDPDKKTQNALKKAGKQFQIQKQQA